jgi:hypothetical protein
MMRLRRASVIAVLSSLAWAVTASAERPWILWSQGVRNKTAINWFTVGAYPSLNECRTALQEAAENLQNSGYELVDTVESITAIKDNDNFTGLTCFTDTVDPRGPKGSDGRRESPRRVLRRRTGCAAAPCRSRSGINDVPRRSVMSRLIALLVGLVFALGAGTTPARARPC